MAINYDELEEMLRKDAGDYGVMKRGVPMSHELSWDAREQRAWVAADTIKHLRLIVGLIDPREVAEAEQKIASFYDREN